MRRAKHWWRQGLLLIEAVLAAGVIATGLVLVSRALGGQASVIGRVDERDAALVLGRSKLAELEAARLAGLPASDDDRGGTFEEPFQDYAWSLQVHPRDDLVTPDGSPLAVQATVTITRSPAQTALASLTAVWPADWVSE